MKATNSHPFLLECLLSFRKLQQNKNKPTMNQTGYHIKTLNSMTDYFQLRPRLDSDTENL